MLKKIKSLLEYSEGKAQISRLAFDLYKKEIVQGSDKKKTKKSNS